MHLDIVSKHRAALYGFAILWVVIFHSAAINHVDWTFGHPSLALLATTIGVGNVGVDVFLFLSGISLYYSFHRNPDISGFLRKRVVRVVPAVWVVYICWWGYRYLIANFDLSNFLGRMSLMNFWMTGDASIWYVALIMVLYFLYPFFYHFLFDEGHRPVVRVIVLLVAVVFFVVLLEDRNHDLYQMVEIALTRFPVFILGCFAGKYTFEKKVVSKAWIPVAFLGIALFLFVKHLDVLEGYYLRFFYIVGGISISYGFALICEAFGKIKGGEYPRPIYRIFAFTGAFSLELYLTHIMLNQVMRSFPWYVEGDLGQYMVMAVIAYVLAWVVMKLIGFVKGLLAKRAETATPHRRSA